MIRIRIGGHEYGSWDEVPEELKAQLIAAGVDPGPDGRIDTADLWRAGGPVVQRTEVTGPDGKPLPPLVGEALARLFDALDPPPPLRAGPSTQSAAEPTGAIREPDTSIPAAGDVQPAKPGRLPLLVWGVVIAATALFVATVVAIVGH